MEHDRSVGIDITGFGLWSAHGNAESWLKALESGRSAVTMHRFADEQDVFPMPFAAAPASPPPAGADEPPLELSERALVFAAREAFSKIPSRPSSVSAKLYLAASQAQQGAVVFDLVAQDLGQSGPLWGVDHEKGSKVAQVSGLLRRAFDDLWSGRTKRAVLGVSHQGVCPRNVRSLRIDKSLAATPARAMSFVHGHEGLAPADACGFLVLEEDASRGLARIEGVACETWKGHGRKRALDVLMPEKRAAPPDIVFVSGTRNSRDDKELLDAVKEAFDGLLVPMRSLDDIGGYAGGAGIVFGIAAAARALSSGILSKRTSPRAGVVVLEPGTDAVLAASLTRPVGLKKKSR